MSTVIRYIHMRHALLWGLVGAACGAGLCVALIEAAPPGRQDTFNMLVAMCLGSTAPRSSEEAHYLEENNAIMAAMMSDMRVEASGDIDKDFVAMMIPHHQGAINMALAVLRHGRNPRIKRLAQEIVVTQRQEIEVMRLAVGQPLLPSANLSAGQELATVAPQ